MLRRSCLLVGPFLLSLIGCAPQAAAPDLEQARASLREADALYGKAGSTKSQADFVAFYATDAVVYPPGAAAVSGLPAISAFLDGFFKDPAFAANFQPAVVDVSADGSMGTTLSIADITITGPDGKPATEHIRDFHVWRRQQDGSWKLWVDIWNAEPVPAAAPPKD
jgi:ketosteroid isomerase-like protein